MGLCFRDEMLNNPVACLAQEFYIVGSEGVFLFARLGQLANVQSIIIGGSVYSFEENQLDFLLKYEKLHRAVRQIYAGSTYLHRCK